MLKHERSIPFVLILSILVFACNLPAVAPASTEPPAAGDAATPTSTPVAAVPVQECNPIVTAITVANVRNGPDIVYNIVGNLPQGGTAPVAGKSFDGTWWYIQFPGGNGGFAWIAGSVTTATCIPTTLPVIAAPPPPVVEPSKTPKPGAPDPTAVPTTSGPFLPPFLIDPPIIIFIPSPTPAIVIPTFEIPEIPCFFC